MSVAPKESPKGVKLVRFALFIAGCTCFGYAFGWLVGVGIFCCTPATFSVIRGK